MHTANATLPPEQKPAGQHGALLASVDDFATLIGVSRGTVYNLMKRKKLRSVTIAGCRRIPVSEAHRLAQQAA